MAEVTIAQFADVLLVLVDRLIAQLDQAGISVSGPQDRISEEAKLELLDALRRSHGHGLGSSAQSHHPQAQDSERTQARQQPGARAHRERRSAAPAHLHQARCARGPGTRATGAGRRTAARSRGGATRTNRTGGSRAARARARRGGEPPAYRGGAGPQEGAGRGAAGWRRSARVEEAERERQRRAAEAARGSPSPPPAAREEQDDAKQRTRYGREELHIAGDVSARHKKKRKPRARAVAVGGEAKHGFRDADGAGEARGRARRDHHGGRTRPEDGRQGNRSDHGADEPRGHGYHQPADRARHRCTSGRGARPHRQAGESKIRWRRRLAGSGGGAGGAAGDASRRS